MKAAFDKMKAFFDAAAAKVAEHPKAFMCAAAACMALCLMM